MKLSLQQLSEQTDVPERSIRYYIQKGLLPRPKGETRAAWYGPEHLANLLRIRAWQQQGLSLDAIADLLLAKTQAPVPAQRPGTVQLHSHLHLAAGVELVVCAERAGLSQAQLRQLFQAVQAAYADITAAGDAAAALPAQG
jgi:DNA-binding transcriptional MerR regulator